MVIDAAGSVKDATYRKVKHGAGTIKDAVGSVKDSAYEKAEYAKA